MARTATSEVDRRIHEIVRLLSMAKTAHWICRFASDHWVQRIPRWRETSPSGGTHLGAEKIPLGGRRVEDPGQ